MENKTSLETQTQNADNLNIFQNILDKDEYVVKIYKPDKVKMLISTFLTSFIFYLVIAISIIIGLASDNIINYLTTAILISLGAFVVVLSLEWLFIHLEHKNMFFAYTNKRIIIRKGIFGIDYKSLDMTMIGAVNVNVSLLDKILRRNTGTITFGSTASPIGQNVSLFSFFNITSPYEIYKEIKTVIDDAKFAANNRR